MNRLTSLAVVLWLTASSCGGDDGSGSGSTGGATVTAGDATSASDGSTTVGTSDSGDDGDGSSSGAGDTSTTGGRPQALCAALDVSVVVDPAAPVLDTASRQALMAFLDDLVIQSGAEVRVLTNVGSETLLQTTCLDALPADVADGPVLTWGQDFATHPEADAGLDCVLDAVAGHTPVDGDGAWMFSGLMFPMLFDVDDWPADGAVHLSLLLARDDDRQNNMYGRPGMAVESLVRNVAKGDRRLVHGFAMGTTADELELFTLSLTDHSRYVDHASASFADAIAAWTPAAVQACDDHDYSPMPDMPKGCEHLDVLFVIDGSGSMTDEQAALRGIGGMPPAFKDFTDALVVELDTLTDFRVGVISSEPGATALHTHTDQPVVPAGPMTDCGVDPTQPWIVGPSATFEQDFACIAATMDNTEETTAYNASEALHDPVNAGFLRGDSILFVVMLTDEETWDSTYATRVEIRNRLLDAVGGDLDRIVVLAIAGSQGTFEEPRTVCYGPYGGAAPARRLSSIVYSFRERGLMQDICEAGLATAFAEALDDVVTACKNYGPEG